MTTLAILKSTVADDLERTDLTSQIAAAIVTAIDFYAVNRFYFNETRTATFVTVAGQSRYSSVDDADIPKFAILDGVFIADSGGQVRELYWREPTAFEWLLDSSAARGQPSLYAYYEQSFWLYPIPDAVYTIRPLGVVKKPAPASDGEANNVWMTEAFELIRSAVPRYMALHTIIDQELAMRASVAEKLALSRLRAETARKAGPVYIEASGF